MIRSVSRTIYASPGENVLIRAELIEKVDKIGNFQIETAPPGGYWGIAVPQLPADTVMPRMSQIPSFIGIVSHLEKTTNVSYPCLYPTWIRIVQYLSKDQKPSVFARIDIEQTKWERAKKIFHKIFHRVNIEPPQERVY